MPPQRAPKRATATERRAFRKMTNTARKRRTAAGEGMACARESYTPWDVENLPEPPVQRGRLSTGHPTPLREGVAGLWADRGVACSSPRDRRQQARQLMQISLRRGRQNGGCPFGTFPELEGMDRRLAHGGAHAVVGDHYDAGGGDHYDAGGGDDASTRRARRGSARRRARSEPPPRDSAGSAPATPSRRGFNASPWRGAEAAPFGRTMTSQWLNNNDHRRGLSAGGSRRRSVSKQLREAGSGALCGTPMGLQAAAAPGGAQGGIRIARPSPAVQLRCPITGTGLEHEVKWKDPRSDQGSVRRRRSSGSLSGTPVGLISDLCGGGEARRVRGAAPCGSHHTTSSMDPAKCCSPSRERPHGGIQPVRDAGRSSVAALYGGLTGPDPPPQGKRVGSSPSPWQSPGRAPSESAPYDVIVRAGGPSSTQAVEGSAPGSLRRSRWGRGRAASGTTAPPDCLTLTAGSGLDLCAAPHRDYARVSSRSPAGALRGASSFTGPGATFADGAGHPPAAGKSPGRMRHTASLSGPAVTPPERAWTPARRPLGRSGTLQGSGAVIPVDAPIPHDAQ